MADTSPLEPSNQYGIRYVTGIELPSDSDCVPPTRRTARSRRAALLSTWPIRPVPRARRPGAGPDHHTVLDESVDEGQQPGGIATPLVGRPPGVAGDDADLQVRVLQRSARARTRHRPARPCPPRRQLRRPSRRRTAVEAHIGIRRGPARRRPAARATRPHAIRRRTARRAECPGATVRGPALRPGRAGGPGTYESEGDGDGSDSSDADDHRHPDRRSTQQHGPLSNRLTIALLISFVC